MDHRLTLYTLYQLSTAPLLFGSLLTSAALPRQHLRFQQEQFVGVRKQFKTSINESHREREVREGEVRERRRDEVVRRREEEDEEGGKEG